MSIRAYVILVGLLVGIAGYICVFTPAEVTVAGQILDCGSIASPASTVPCADELSDRKGWVIPLMLGGFFLAAGGSMTRKETAPTGATYA